MRIIKKVFFIVLIGTSLILAVMYNTLRHNYVAMISSLRTCRNLASSINELMIKGVPTNDPSYSILMEGEGKFCFMGGDPDNYAQYLLHPFSKIFVEEGVDGYSSKIIIDK